MIQNDKIITYNSLLSDGMLMEFDDSKLLQIGKMRKDALYQIRCNLYLMDTIGREVYLAHIIGDFQDACFFYLRGNIDVFGKPENKELFENLKALRESAEAFIIELKILKNVFILKGLKDDITFFDYAKDYENRKINFENDRLIFTNLKDLRQHADKVLKGGFIKLSQKDLFVKQFAAIKPDEKNKVEWLGSNPELICFMSKIMVNGKRNVANAKKIFNRPKLKDGDYDFEQIPKINKLFR